MAFIDRPAPDARSFRDALGRFATGVALVTSAVDRAPAGLIVNSLASVSLEPPLLSFCPARSSLTWSRMRRTGRFGVNVLGRRHERFVERAAPAGADRFTGLRWEFGPGGVPLVTDALVAVECDIVAEHPTGDHWIVVGRVNSIRMPPTDDPLVFFAGAFCALEPFVHADDARAPRKVRGGGHRRSTTAGNDASRSVAGTA